MSEQPGEYKANFQPDAIIEPPRTVKALHDGEIVDYEVWGWVKTSAKFRKHIKILRGAKHDIWHYLALGVDETGKCKETIKEICEGTGYSHTEVINTLRELDEMGYLSVQKDSRGNTYAPEFVARGAKNPTESAVKKVESTGVESTPVYQVESTPPIEKLHPIPLRVKRVNTEIPQNMPLEWYIQHDLPIPEHLTENNRAEKESLDNFEQVLGFGELPWDSTKDWKKLRDFVVAKYQSNENVWRDYQAWRNGKGKYDAMSNKQIRLKPDVFMDTGFPSFVAHSAMNPDDDKPLRML